MPESTVFYQGNADISGGRIPLNKREAVRLKCGTGVRRGYTTEMQGKLNIGSTQPIITLYFCSFCRIIHILVIPLHTLVVLLE